MGSLEAKSKEKNRKENVQKIILATIKTAGLVSFALLAPNAIVALSKLGLIERNRKYRVNRSVGALLKKGLIEFEKTAKGTFVRLTPAGENRLNRYYDGGALPRPKKWDGKWRIVTYDLKEKKKSLREKLRLTLSGFGFVKLQNSVWVYPYDCEDLIMLMKADFKIGKEVLYVIADKIEYDQSLRSLFGLPKSLE